MGKISHVFTLYALLGALLWLGLISCSNPSTPSSKPTPSSAETHLVPNPEGNREKSIKGSQLPDASNEDEMELPDGHVFPWTSWAIGALIRSIASEDENIWIGTTNGLIRFHKPDESVQVFTSRDGLMNNIIVSILVGPNGHKWIGTYGGGLHEFDGEKWKVYTPYGRGSTDYGPQWIHYPSGDGLGDLWVYDSIFDPQGTLWVATWKGVSRFDGEKFQTFSTGDGLADKWVYTLSIDQDGSLWFGTEGGINRFDGKSWKTWTHQDGLGADESLVGSEEAKLEIQLPSGHHLQTGKEASGYNPNYIVSSVIDSQGTKWFGTWGGGLSRFDGKTWKNFTTRDGLAGNTVNALALEDNGVLWIGTNNGVSRYHQGKFTTFRTMDGLISNSVFAIAVEEDGTKWFGAYGGVSRYTGH